MILVQKNEVKMETESNIGIIEDVKFISKWLDEAEILANKIRTLSKKGNGLAIFTISTTVKKTKNNHPYFTPIRNVSHGYIAGSVVFSQTQAILLCKRIDGLIDQILVDSEKKTPITLGFEKSVMSYFNLEVPTQHTNARVHVEMGNLSAACQSQVTKSRLREYKPNDITVDAVWHFLANRFHSLSGKRAAIIGAGNIGFKLGLKLVESGCHVELVRRDLWRGTQIADTINIVKPQSTIAIAHFNPNPLQASLFCDIILGCTDGTPAITWDMIQCMKPDGIIIDIGKGSVCIDAIQLAIKNEIPIIRCDITPAMDGLISTIKKTQIMVEKEMGRKEIAKGVFIISGGYMGYLGDIVVDNFNNPMNIIGVANGKGDWVKELAKNDYENIAIVKSIIQSEDNDSG